MNNKRQIGISTDYNYLNRKNFADYRQNGIEVFELCVEEEALYPTLNLKQIVADAIAEDVCAWSFHLPYYYFEGTVISAICEEGRNCAVKYQSEWIKKIADAGFQYAVIHPSNEPIADEYRKIATEHAKYAVAELSEVAKQEGIVLAVENLPRSCLGNCSDEILELLSLAPHARACLDTNHFLNESPMEFIKKVSDKIVTMHISDYDFIDERHWLPGEGLVDWKRLMDLLDEIGYMGAMIYEIPRSKNAIPTIFRERDLNPGDYRQNADELFSRSTLTKRGTILI